MFVFFLFLYLQTPAAQQGSPWWYTLEEGKRHFRQGQYGDALRCFETARDSRKNFYAKKEQDLITVLSLHGVRRLQDDLGLIEIYIEKEFRVDAADALKELYYRVPREKLHNSARRALSELGRLKAYPEAEYWIGEVYRMEGEYGIALAQYQKVYDQRTLLEIPDFTTGVLYKIADLRRLRREYAEMTTALEEIIHTDGLWGRESFDRSNMLQSLENNGVNRFLVLFRHKEPAVERAHRILGLYYYASGRHSRAADHLLFAFLIQNSVLIDVLVKSRYDYAFTSLEDLLRDLAGNREVQSYITEVEYYRAMYYLANSLYGSNRRRSAREIWTFLSGNAPAEWRGRAAAQLRNPAMDPLNEAIVRPAVP
jgi:tetratricopeptide (TPR) repeat protein